MEVTKSVDDYRPELEVSRYAATIAILENIELPPSVTGGVLMFQFDDGMHMQVHFSRDVPVQG